MQNKTNKNQGSKTNKRTSFQKTPLQDIFAEENSLGWKVLDSQSILYSDTEVTMDKIFELTSHYMKIIEKLNSLQDSRQQYFTFKMQKLMSQPYVIRCFSSQTDTKPALQSRRKQLEQTIQKEAERQNHRAIVKQTIQAQKKKEEYLRNTVKNAVLESNRKLDERIRKRTLNRLERSMNQSHLSTSLDNSLEMSSGSDSRCRTAMTSTDFSQYISEQESKYRALKRKIQEEEEQEREAMRMEREMGLWKNK